MTTSSPWRSVATFTLSNFRVALSWSPAPTLALVDLIVVISTSGRSQASTVNTPTEFLNLSVPPDGKSMRSVLLTSTFVFDSSGFGASAASSAQPVPSPIAASINLVFNGCPFRQRVAFSCNPHVKSRQQNNAQRQGGKQAADDDNRERPLRIGSDFM